MLQKEVEDKYNAMFDRERDMWVATVVMEYTPAETSLPAYPKVKHPDPQYHGLVVTVPNYTLHVEEAIKALNQPLPNGAIIAWEIQRLADRYCVKYDSDRYVYHENLSDAVCLAAICARLVDEVDENDWAESTQYF
jgi:hypothetical protein